MGRAQPQSTAWMRSDAVIIIAADVQTLRKVCQRRFPAVLTTSLSDNKFKTRAFLTAVPLEFVAVLRSMAVREGVLRKPGSCGGCILRSSLGQGGGSWGQAELQRRS